MPDPKVAQAPAHLQVQDLAAAYGSSSRLALDDVTFRVPVGTRVAVVGPNGAGKSTLFKVLVGLLPKARGEVLIHGAPALNHKECIAYVPQREDVDWRFPVNVEDVVMMGRYGTLGWLKRPGKTDHAVVARCLEEMGIQDLATRSIGDLSGGQQQRVFLARALAQEPHILLMDEPFTGVDATTQEATLGLLDQLQAQGVTLMVSTHDMNLAASRFERVLLLNRRVIAYGAPNRVFTRENLLRAFGTHALLIDGQVVVDDCCPGDEHLSHDPLFVPGTSPTLEQVEG